MAGDGEEALRCIADFTPGSIVLDVLMPKPWARQTTLPTRSKHDIIAFVDERNAVLDASFWINAYHAEVVDYLSDYFNLFAPTAVIQEVEYTPPDVDQLTPAGEGFRRWRQTGRLKLRDPTRPVDWFQAGENAAIGLAREQRYVLLIDDQAPYHLAKARGLRAVASTDFIVLLYADGLLSYHDAQARLVGSGIARHLKRAAMTALAFLARQRGDYDDDDIS